MLTHPSTTKDMNKQHWDNFYNKSDKQKESTFAEFCVPYMNNSVIELGCGDGRDIEYFCRKNILAKGVDQSYENSLIIKSDVLKYIKNNKCSSDVYTRFFWHAIDRDSQLNILKWVNHNLFIEARTTEDRDRKKIYADHDRNYVDVTQLVKDLKDSGFQILFFKEGTGLSKFRDEDPHLVRVIARKSK